MNHISELKKIANGMSKYNKKLSGEVLDVSKKLVTASLMEPGMIVVCTNPLQPLLKGRLYVVGQKVKPGYNVILEEDASPIGVFSISRFLPDWNAY